MIYLCKIVGMPIVKIGYSEHFPTRLYNINQAMPFTVECLAERNGSIGLEEAVHKKCLPFLIKGEWFVDCEAVRNAFFTEYDPYPELKRKKQRHSFLREREESRASREFNGFLSKAGRVKKPLFQ